MRVCESCGRENVDRNKFCIWCGKTFLTDEDEAEIAVQEAAPAVEAVTAGENLPVEESEEEAPEAKYPMKWHKFLMVMLIIGGIFEIIVGLGMLTGTWYEVQGVNIERVYRFYPALKTMNWILGVVSIGLGGVFRFTVRKRLKNFMESGPRSLMVLYGATIAVSVVYLLALTAVLGVSLADTGKEWPRIVFSACSMYAQKKYYDKRKDLFVN